MKSPQTNSDISAKGRIYASLQIVEEIINQTDLLDTGDSEDMDALNNYLLSADELKARLGIYTSKALN